LLTDKCDDFLDEHTLKHARKQRDRGVQTVSLTYALHQAKSTFLKIPEGQERLNACAKLREDLIEKNIDTPAVLEEKLMTHCATKPLVK
jgi:hypothetical protein